MANGSLFNGKRDPRNKIKNLFPTNNAVVDNTNIRRVDNFSNKKLFSEIDKQKIKINQKLIKVIRSGDPGKSVGRAPQSMPDYKRDKAIYDVINKNISFNVDGIKVNGKLTSKGTDSISKLYSGMNMKAFDDRQIQMAKDYGIKFSTSKDNATLAFQKNQTINLAKIRNKLFDEQYSEKDLQKLINLKGYGQNFRSIPALKSEVYKTRISIEDFEDPRSLGVLYPGKDVRPTNIDFISRMKISEQYYSEKNKTFNTAIDQVLIHETAHSMGSGYAYPMTEYAKQNFGVKGDFKSFLRNYDYTQKDKPLELFARYNQAKSYFKNNKNADPNKLYMTMIDLHQKYNKDKIIPFTTVVGSNLRSYGETTEFLLGKNLYKNMPTMKEAENLSKLFKQF